MESVLGAADQETKATISQEITAVLNSSNEYRVNLDYSSLRTSTRLSGSTGDRNCLTGKQGEQPSMQNLKSIPGGVSMEIATVPGKGVIPNAKLLGTDSTLPYDCQNPIFVEVSGETSFVASRVELAWLKPIG